MVRVAAIMAGGRGQRLWPASRTRRPKQFLNLGAGPSLLQQTYDRLSGIADPPEVLVLTAADTVGLVRAQLPHLAPDRVLGEPVMRDTTATAALAVAMARAVAGDEAVLALVPADHVVFAVQRFRAALSAGWDAAVREACPVLLGIPPSRPETGYGYILRGSPLWETQDLRVAAIARFVEKPDVRRAAEYLRSGRYLWNAGVCICRTDVLVDALALHQPEVAALVEDLRDVNPALVAPEEMERRLAPLQGISLDFGVLEHLQRALVVEVPLAWDDVGNWDELARLRPQDAHGNVRVGQAVLSDTQRTVVVGTDPGRLVVTHGVRDLVVVDTSDSILVADRAALPELKRALSEVRSLGFAEYLDEAAGAAAPAARAEVRGRADAVPGPDVEILTLRAGTTVPAEELAGRPVRLVSGDARVVSGQAGTEVLSLGGGSPRLLAPGTRLVTDAGCLVAVGSSAAGPGSSAWRRQAAEPILVHEDACTVVPKPWGREVWWVRTEGYVGKRLEVRAGHALSLQFHQAKHETLYVLSGEVRLRLGDDERVVGPGYVAVVPPGTVHRMEAVTDAVIVEVSTPEVDDVVRLEDRYGRSGPHGG